MLKEVLGSGLKARYIVFDTHYSCGWFTKMVTRLGLVWVGTLHPRTIVYWRGKRRSVGELARVLPLKWRKHLGVRTATVRLYAPKYGPLRLVVTRNRHANYECIVTNELGADLTEVVLRKVSRWQVETLFRDAMHHANAPIPGIEATEEELRKAALAIALDLASSQHRDDGRP